jgi:hypothetical protein
MSKVRDISGLANIIKTDANGNVTFVSGSTTLMAISSSGAVTSTGTIGGSNSSTLATTGSNTFTGQQYVSNTNAPVNFTDTASLYTDGGLRVGKDAYVSGTLYLNDLTVYGTQSVNYITSSQLDIADNIITVNTSTPQIRFGGIAVRDSGSEGTGLTGSLLWDSQNNHWVYTNPSGSSYSGGMMISGPRASSLGSEQGTTNNALMKGQGGDHITSSAVFEVSGSVGIGLTNPSNKLEVQAGDIKINANVSSTASLYFGITGTNYGKIQYDDSNQSMLITTVGSGFSGYNLNLGTKDNIRLSILGSNGNVGIGTTSPSEMLHLNNSSTNAAFIRFQNISGSGVYIGGRNNDMELYAGGSERMRISGSGNVGIGTNSPIAYSGYTSLTIGGSNTGLLKFRSTYNSGDGAEIYQNTSGTIFFNTNGSQGAMAITSGGALAIGTSTVTYSNYKFQARVASDRNLAIGVQGTDVSIEAYNDAVSANVPLRIYGNNISLIGGSVLKPNNPAFRAYYSVNSTWTLANDATFVFNATEYNIGSCYNTSNGRFTAPVAGVYQFNFYSIVLDNYQNAAISFRKNGGAPTSGFNIHFSPYQTASVWDNVVYTTSLYLNAGDYVYVTNSGGGSVNYHGDDWSSFSGYLVG